jgi:hypothetical protein
MSSRTIRSTFLFFLIASVTSIACLAQDSLHVRHAGTLDLPGTPSHIVISGNYAYVSCMGGGLRIVDISDPAAPSLTGSFQPGIVWETAVRDSFAFTACDESGMRVVNVAHPATPVQVGYYRDHNMVTQRYIALRDSFAYIGESDTVENSRLQAVNIVDPTQPVAANHMSIIGPHIMHMKCSGQYGIMAEGPTGTDAVNLHFEGSPVRITSWADTCYDVAIGNDQFFLARAAGDTGTGLLVCSLADLPSRVVSGFCPLPGTPRGVAASGTHAFVAAGERGLRIVDADTPSEPREVGFYDTPGFAEGVAVRGNYAYVADGNALQVYDCTEALAAGDRNIATQPSSFKLRAYPNPFNPATTISFEVAAPGWVTLTIVDLEGREVSNLASQRLLPGSYSYMWNAEAYASGTYFAKVQTLAGTFSQRLVLIK